MSCTTGKTFQDSLTILRTRAPQTERINDIHEFLDAAYFMKYRPMEEMLDKNPRLAAVGPDLERWSAVMQVVFNEGRMETVINLLSHYPNIEELWKVDAQMKKVSQSNQALKGQRAATLTSPSQQAATKTLAASVINVRYLLKMTRDIFDEYKASPATVKGLIDQAEATSS